MKIQDAIDFHMSQGRSKETARRKTYLDMVYGRCEKPTSIHGMIDGIKDCQIPIALRLADTSGNCRYCVKPVAEDDAQVQAAYWTPNSYMLFHKECHALHWKDEVYEQQKIDMDCNECAYFKATAATDKFGNRPGILCGRTGVETTAYPGGAFCSYPSHEQCFTHRKYAQ